MLNALGRQAGGIDSVKMNQLVHVHIRVRVGKGRMRVHRKVDGVLRIHLIQARPIVRDGRGILGSIQVCRRASAHHGHRRGLVDNGRVAMGEGERRDGRSYPEVRRVHHRREEGAAVRRVEARGREWRALGTLRCVEVGARVIRWRRRRSGRHGVLSHVQAETSLRINAKVRPESAHGIGLLGDRREDIRAMRLGLGLAGMLNVERRHGSLQHREVDGHGNRPAALSLVARAADRRGKTDAPLLLLVHADVRLGEVGLRRRPVGGRDRGRHGDGVELVERIGVVSVHEGFQRDQLGELTAQHLGVSSQVVRQDLRSLLVFCEVADLNEAIRGGSRVHEEVWRTVELDNDAAELVRVTVRVLKEDVLDVRERVFDLVARLLVVDVVCHRTLVGRVKNDEVHRVLADSRPLADAQGAAGKMVNHCVYRAVRRRPRGDNSRMGRRGNQGRLTNFALGVLIPGEKHVAVAVRHETCASEESTSDALTRLHSLHGQVLSHGFGDGIDILASLQALLGEQLDLGASIGNPSEHTDAHTNTYTDRGKHGILQFGGGGLTGSETRSEQTFRSC